MIIEQLTKLNDLFNKVEDFLKTVDRDEFVSDGFLRHFNSLEPRDDEVLPGGLTKEYIDLLGEVDLELCGSFITNQGQSSSLFFKAREHGWITRVIEKDSFGPLICAVRRNDLDWMVCYG